MVLRGGGIPNLEVIQTEVSNILTGNAEQIRDFLGKLNTFTDQLNQQRDDLTRAIDSTNELLTIFAKRDNTLDRVLDRIPAADQVFRGHAGHIHRRGGGAGPVRQCHGDNACRRRAPNSTPTCSCCSVR